MGTHFLVPLSSGGAAEVVFEGPAPPGAQGYGVADDFAKRSVDTLEDALNMVKAVGECAVRTLSGLNVDATEATIGLKISAKGKFVIAETTAEASLSVKFVLKKAS